MLAHLLISVISDDKPGVIEAIAEVVAEENGNWLESRLSQLAGKFAGVIRVSTSENNIARLQTQLSALESQGIWIKCDVLQESPKDQSSLKVAYVHALGPDRPGIVRELSHAFTQHHINVAELETALSSMPYSGDPLFEATGNLEIPGDVDIQELQDVLLDIADSLALDISLSETPHEH